MSTDATQIQNTLTNERYVPNDYADVQWQYIFDQNNGSYSNSIQFITTILKTQLIDYCNAFLWIPLRIASSGVAYTADTPIAYRESILQLINQITFSTDTGNTLIAENLAPYYINAIRMRLEKSFDYFEINGDQLQMSRCIDKWLNVENPVKASDAAGLNCFPRAGSTYALDYNANVTHAVDAAGYWNNPYKYLRTSTATADALNVNPPVNASNRGFVYADNPYCNEGFRQRIGLFKNMYTFSGGNYDSVAMIPIALLHDIFRSLNFACFNIGFNFQFYLTSPNGIAPSLPVMMTSDYCGNNPIDTPIITYGAVATAAAQGSGSCRLYYRSVKFNLRDNALLSSHLASNNFNKSINFITTDLVNDRNSQGYTFQGGEFTTPFMQEIATGSVYPLRVWILAYPTDALNGGRGAHRWPLTNCPFYIDDLNIQINGVLYKKLNMKWHQDHWNELSAQFPSDVSTVLTHGDHRRFCRWTVIDIQRLGLERLTSPTEPVSLAVTGNLKRDPDCAQLACKIVYLIERMNEITFRFSQTDTSAVIGNISLNNTAA